MIAGTALARTNKGRRGIEPLATACAAATAVATGTKASGKVARLIAFSEMVENRHSRHRTGYSTPTTGANVGFWLGRATPVVLRYAPRWHRRSPSAGRDWDAIPGEVGWRVVGEDCTGKKSPTGTVTVKRHRCGTGPVVCPFHHSWLPRSGAHSLLCCLCIDLTYSLFHELTRTHDTTHTASRPHAPGRPDTAADRMVPVVTVFDLRRRR